MNESVLSHIRFYFEDNDHKPVDFNNETISFTCQLIKIKDTDTYNCFCTYNKVYIQVFDIYNYMYLYEF